MTQKEHNEKEKRFKELFLQLNNSEQEFISNLLQEFQELKMETK